jgi:hypothetical protein
MLASQPQLGGDRRFRSRFGGAADLVGERLAAPAELGLEWSALLQNGERHLERIEHRNLSW